ncbi:MAG: dihydrofolate reductase [Bacteroidales bacterium]|nr:dihydrofolate reductase [Bacteroidales bacterium]
MKKHLKTMMLFTAAFSAFACSEKVQEEKEFNYTDERFADVQILHYEVEGFENLSLQQKTFIYYLNEAALWGRDILFDQNGRYNLEIRTMLEEVYQNYKGDKNDKNFKALEEYLKRVWFSNGIHHHYGSEKFVPGFEREWFVAQTKCSDEIAEVIFNPNVMPKKINLAEGVDLIATSACNYYQGVTQEEAEKFYAELKAKGDQKHPVMYGMNSTLVKDKDGKIYEDLWIANGKYGKAITKIVENLKLARPYAEDAKQQEVIDKLIAFYETGDLKIFDEYSIAWTENTEPVVDFVNGFIESYGDPLGMKASWESIVNFKDIEATKRTEAMSNNAQWFEDNSPVAKEYKKESVKGVSAKVINAAILGGDLFPSTAIGINLPNSNWIRAEHGSKSVTIGNLTEAYAQSSNGSGMLEEFAYSQTEIDIIKKYGQFTDDLHTDLHECLGHGSGKLLPGVDPEALKAYGSTIEEARADLFALYYLADAKMVELGLLPDAEAYKASYISQMQNGLLTQIVRIKLGDQIEESHMRDRALIARWAYEHGKGAGKDGKDVIEMVKRDGETFVKINDYEMLRNLFGQLLAEIQRIKSTGDFNAARDLVENYAVKIDAELHKEVLDRYTKLNIAPYKGFVNPVYTAVKDKSGKITDVKISYEEGYTEQMLRYSKDYSPLK